MSNSHIRHFVIALLCALIVACGTGGGAIGPTIADLDSEVEFEADELGGFDLDAEPRADFKIDRQQVIDSFRALIAVTAEGGGTGDELRRLADLELEASLDNRLAEDENTRLRGEQEALHAIGIYEGYLQKYPGREDNDMIMYQLSRAYALEEENDKSLALLDTIAADHPESQYIDEVQFRRGEHLFVIQDFDGAEQAYGAVVNNHPDSLFFEKALYKYGWTQFKQSNHDAALASFVQLLDVNLENGNIRQIDFSPELSRANQELLEDVARVMSLSFSYQDEKHYISQYFNRNGQRDYEPLLYKHLGELYLGQKRLVDGSDLFLAYTREYPYSPHTPYFHQRAIEVYQEAGYADLVLKEKIAFVERYDVNGEFWNLQSAATQQQMTETLVLNMTELANHFHAQARASKKPADYQVTAGWYRRFLTSFPKDKTAPRMNFLLAESLFDARQYPQAIDEYQKTAYEYGGHPDGAEAGYAALVSFDTMFKSTNASEIPALRRKRIKSAVRFTTTYPDDPRLSAVELQTAKQFLEWKEYPDAMASARRMINNDNVDKPTKKTAWTILSDAQFSSNDFAGAEKSYLTLLGYLPASDKQHQAVREQVAASIYKQGEIARDGDDHLLAASHFSRLGKVIPESPKRIVADYDAATAYVQLEDWSATISLLETFRKRYPKDKKFSAGVTEKLALAYSQSGNQAKAAGEMLTLSSMPGSAERKRDLMWRAAELYEKDGQQDKAIRIYKDYVKVYPYPLERSMELRHKISESYRAKNDTRNLNIWLNEIVRADAAAKSRRTARSKYLAATASLELIAPLHRNYRKAKLTVPLKKSLRKKKQLMQQTIDAYSKAMNYQVQEVTTESTYQIAEIYHDFAKSLMNSQRPKGLDEEQMEEYELLLEEQAFPFEEKAIDIHLANFKRIPAGSYDEPIRKSLQVLGELMPFRFAKVESPDVYVDIQ